jgi:phosphoglycerate dehydrogenase-like enzyme
MAAGVREREPRLTVEVAADDHDLARRLEDADALLATMRFPQEVLARARRLRWIQVTAAGVEQFMTTPHLPRGVKITRLVGTFGPRMAEYAFAYALAIVQDVPRALRQQAARNWEPFDQGSLHGKTLAVVGVGKIGGAVGRVGAALGMRVVGVASRPRTARGFARVYGRRQLEAALARAHLVVDTLPTTPETTGLFGAAQFASMRAGAIFLNMGRGTTVQDTALLDGLRAGRPAWAVLDVFNEEPLPPSHPYWTTPNVIVTPHLAGHTLPDEAVDAFCENLRRWRRGRRLANLVNIKRGY